MNATIVVDLSRGDIENFSKLEGKLEAMSKMIYETEIKGNSFKREVPIK